MLMATLSVNVLGGIDIKELDIFGLVSDTNEIFVVNPLIINTGFIRVTNPVDICAVIWLKVALVSLTSITSILPDAPPKSPTYNKWLFTIVFWEQNQ